MKPLLFKSRPNQERTDINGKAGRDTSPRAGKEKAVFGKTTGDLKLIGAAGEFSSTREKVTKDTSRSLCFCSIHAQQPPIGIRLNANIGIQPFGRDFRIVIVSQAAGRLSGNRYQRLVYV